MTAITMRRSITAGLHDVMSAHDDAIMLGEALDTRGGASEITYGFLQRYGGNRVIETPISENALVGMALGAAVAGLRVVAEVYSADFIVCAGSEVVNDIAKWRYQHQWKKPLRLVLRMPAGSAGKWAGPEHTQSIEGILNNVPGLRIVVPSTLMLEFVAPAYERRFPCAVRIQGRLRHARAIGERPGRGLAHSRGLGQDLLHPRVRRKWLALRDTDRRQ